MPLSCIRHTKIEVSERILQRTYNSSSRAIDCVSSAGVSCAVNGQVSCAGPSRKLCNVVCSQIDLFTTDLFLCAFWAHSTDQPPMWEVLYIQITCPSPPLVLPTAPFWRKRKGINKVSLCTEDKTHCSFAFVPQLSELDDGGRCRRFEPVQGTPRGRGNVTSLQAHPSVALSELSSSTNEHAKFFVGQSNIAQLGRTSDTPTAFLEVL